MQVAALLFVLAQSLACGSAPERAPAAASATTPSTDVAPRELGAWKGTGNATLGFVSESGSFRINWKAVSKAMDGTGTFQLTLRSGISGRPLKVIADHRGPGGGSVEFGDDPRGYEFLVQSAGMDWTISVDETFAPRK